MTKAKPTPLKEWRANSGTPPQGKYLLDMGHEQHEVDVGYKVFTWEGKTRHISKAFQFGILLGPLPETASSPAPASTSEPTPEPAQTPVPNPLDIDAQADAAIREALHTLAATPSIRKGPTIAPKLIEAYGPLLQKVRQQNHGWGKIVKIFRAQGIHISVNFLKSRLNGNEPG